MFLSSSFLQVLLLSNRILARFDYQTTVHIQVCQGKNCTFDPHIIVGEVLVIVPPRPAGEEVIEVTYSYDINGLLEVEARVVSTGKSKKFISNRLIHYFS